MNRNKYKQLVNKKRRIETTGKRTEAARNLWYTGKHEKNLIYKQTEYWTKITLDNWILIRAYWTRVVEVSTKYEWK